MRNTKQFEMRGFHILSDAIGHFTPIDGICQFLYKGYQISISTAGLSKGACQTEVAIFHGENFETEVQRTRTVEEAIRYIDQLNSPALECQIVEVPYLEDPSPAHKDLHRKVKELIDEGWVVMGFTNNSDRHAIWVRNKVK